MSAMLKRGHEAAAASDGDDHQIAMLLDNRTPFLGSLCFVLEDDTSGNSPNGESFGIGDIFLAPAAV